MRLTLCARLRSATIAICQYRRQQRPVHRSSPSPSGSSTPCSGRAGRWLPSPPARWRISRRTSRWRSTESSSSSPRAVLNGRPRSRRLWRVERSTAGRMCDRLVRKGLMQRRRESADRRAVRISLTKAGRDLVDEVTRRRRSEIARILRRMPVADRGPVRVALRAFADAAGEVPEQAWSLGWRVHA